MAAEYQRSRGPSSVRATAFLLHNSLNLFSNFTYLLDDPEHGDQFEQAERRTAAGGHVTYRRLGHLYERHTESAVGVQLRSDWLDPVGLYHTQGRQRLSTTREDQVGQTMASAFAQTEIEWTRALRTTAGLRADVYRFSVTSDNRLNSGDGSDAIVSPKFGAVLGPWAGTELYVNAGMGFHSNDARGATIRVDPARGEFVDRVTPLVRARGAEVGMRTVRVRGLQSTVDLWYLGLDSELLLWVMRVQQSRDAPAGGSGWNGLTTRAYGHGWRSMPISRGRTRDSPTTIRPATSCRVRSIASSLLD